MKWMDRGFIELLGPTTSSLLDSNLSGISVSWQCTEGSCANLANLPFANSEVGALHKRVKAAVLTTHDKTVGTLAHSPIPRYSACYSYRCCLTPVDPKNQGHVMVKDAQLFSLLTCYISYTIPSLIFHSTPFAAAFGLKQYMTVSNYVSHGKKCDAIRQTKVGIDS
jgi:hypothetical protein